MMLYAAGSSWRLVHGADAVPGEIQRTFSGYKYAHVPQEVW